MLLLLVLVSDEKKKISDGVMTIAKKSNLSSQNLDAGFINSIDLTAELGNLGPVDNKDDDDDEEMPPVSPPKSVRKKPKSMGTWAQTVEQWHAKGYKLTQEQQEDL